jgi:hypothetical protein
MRRDSPEVPAEAIARLEIERIRERWSIATPTEKLPGAIFQAYLDGIAEAVAVIAQKSLNQRIDDINGRISCWNRANTETGDLLREVTDQRIADLLAVNRATVTRWRHNPDCGVQLRDFVRLLWVLDLQLCESAPCLPAEALSWAGYQRAIRTVLSLFRAPACIPELTPEVCRDLREDRLEHLHPAHTDAYAAVECALLLSDVLDCVWDVGKPLEGPPQA